MKRNSIKVFAPATVANLACGYDILGLAIDKPGDEVEIRLTDDEQITIEEITGDEGRLSYDPKENTVSVSILKLLESQGITKQGLGIKLHKKMPFGSGLGSSAASSVAGVFAANELLQLRLSKLQILPFAMEGERIACGSAHADNVAPCLFGGIVLIRSYAPLDIIPLAIPKDIFMVVIHPHIEVRTKDARDILKKRINMASAIIQWGNVAGLVAGLQKSDYDLISRSLQDVIVEPARSVLIPGFVAAKAAALDAGALGCSISGSGPSIFAMCKSRETAQQVAQALEEVYNQLGIENESYYSPINTQGPVILD